LVTFQEGAPGGTIPIMGREHGIFIGTKKNQAKLAMTWSLSVRLVQASVHHQVAARQIVSGPMLNVTTAPC
jgi:hypothetical protein